MRNIRPKTNPLWSCFSTAGRALSTAVTVMATACGGGDNYHSSPGPQATSAGCVSGTETLTIVAGNGQTAAPGSLLPEAATVRLTCESFANRGTTIPMVGAAVQWWPYYSLVDGISSKTTQTDSSGTTSVAWTLAYNFAPKGIYVNHVTPRAPEAHVTFNAVTVTTTTTATTCQDAGGTDHGALTVSAVDVAWTAAGSPHRGGTIRLDNNARLSIEAGAVICLAEIAGAVTAEGTAQAPVGFFGTSMPVAPQLSHALVENAMKVGSVTSPAWSITDSTLRWTSARDPLACAQVAASALNRVQISGYGSQECAALHLVSTEPGWYDPYATVAAKIVDSVGDGVFVAGSWGTFSFNDCEVSSSGRHGIVVPVPARAPIDPFIVSVARCNLFGNHGDAISNQSTVKVQASGNWWGDPAGPFGPNGNRTSGDVDAGSPSQAPWSLAW